MKKMNRLSDQALGKYFEVYRNRPDVLSMSEAEGILARPLVLRKSQRFSKRSIIMTTLFVSLIITAASYFFFAEQSTTPPNKANSAIGNGQATAVQSEPSVASTLAMTPRLDTIKKSHWSIRIAVPGLKQTESASVEGQKPFKPVELVESVMRHLGIQRSTNSGYDIYILQSETEVGKVTIAPHNIELREMKVSDVPSTVLPSKTYPILVTTGTGRKCFYQYSEDSVNGQPQYGIRSYDDAAAQEYRRWLETAPKVSGLTIMGYSHNSRDDGKGHQIDTVKIVIGKDIPQFPGANLENQLSPYPESLRMTLKHAAEYLSGMSVRPSLDSLPPGYALAADTLTYQRMLAELEVESHKALSERAQKAAQNVGSLIPITIRESNADHLLGDSDLIFWYEPSEALLAIANISKEPSSASVATSHSHGAIAATSANPTPTRGNLNIKVELTEGRVLRIVLRDLTGKEMRRVNQPSIAHRGASEYRLDATDLPEGVYLLDVATERGEHYTQRVMIVR